MHANAMHAALCVRHAASALQFRMKDFSPLMTNEPVYSDSFDAGIATW
jgi:hypothetical protein